jgi:hypothetical protein
MEKIPGAQLDQPDDDGHTTADYAKEGGQEVALRWLESRELVDAGYLQAAQLGALNRACRRGDGQRTSEMLAIPVVPTLETLHEAIKGRNQACFELIVPLVEPGSEELMLALTQGPGPILDRLLSMVERRAEDGIRLAEASFDFGDATFVALLVELNVLEASNVCTGVLEMVHEWTLHFGVDVCERVGIAADVVLEQAILMETVPGARLALRMGATLIPEVVMLATEKKSMTLLDELINLGAPLDPGLFAYVVDSDMGTGLVLMLQAQPQWLPMIRTAIIRGDRPGCFSVLRRAHMIDCSADLFTEAIQSRALHVAVAIGVTRLALGLSTSYREVLTAALRRRDHAAIRTLLHHHVVPTAAQIESVTDDAEQKELLEFYLNFHLNSGTVDDMRGKLIDHLRKTRRGVTARPVAAPTATFRWMMAFLSLMIGPAMLVDCDEFRPMTGKLRGLADRKRELTILFASFRNHIFTSTWQARPDALDFRAMAEIMMTVVNAHCEDDLPVYIVRDMASIGAGKDFAEALLAFGAKIWPMGSTTHDMRTVENVETGAREAIGDVKEVPFFELLSRVQHCFAALDIPLIKRDPRYELDVRAQLIVLEAGIEMSALQSAWLALLQGCSFEFPLLQPPMFLARWKASIVADGFAVNARNRDIARSARMSPAEVKCWRTFLRLGGSLEAPDLTENPYLGVIRCAHATFAVALSDKPGRWITPIHPLMLLECLPLFERVIRAEVDSNPPVVAGWTEFPGGDIRVIVIQPPGFVPCHFFFDTDGFPLPVPTDPKLKLPWHEHLTDGSLLNQFVPDWPDRVNRPLVVRMEPAEIRTRFVSLRHSYDTRYGFSGILTLLGEAAAGDVPVHTVRTDLPPFVGQDLVEDPFWGRDQSADVNLSRAPGAAWSPPESNQDGLRDDAPVLLREVHRIALLFPLAQRDGICRVAFAVLVAQKKGTHWGTAKELQKQTGVYRQTVSQYLQMIGAADTQTFPMAAGPRGVALATKLQGKNWGAAVFELSRRPDCAGTDTFVVAREVLAYEMRPKVLPDYEKLQKRCGVAKGKIPLILQKLAQDHAHRRLEAAVVQETTPWTDGELRQFWDGRSGEERTIAARICVARIRSETFTNKEIGGLIGRTSTFIAQRSVAAAAYVDHFRQHR